MAFLQDMESLAVTGSLGVSGTSLFTSSHAVIPTDITSIQIIETGGMTPEFIHNSGANPAYQKPRAQVLVRAVDYPTARAKAKQAYDVYQKRNTTINSTRYLFVKPLQEPFDLSPDANGLPRVAFNIGAEKAPS